MRQTSWTKGRWLKGALSRACLCAAVCAVSLGLAQAPPSSAQPEGLTFEVTLVYSAEGNLALHYTLSNRGATPFVVDPANLFVFYGETRFPYRLVRSPPPGRANRLSPEETERGTLFITAPPYDSDNLQLVWELFEIGPGTRHTLLETFGEMTVAVEP